MFKKFVIEKIISVAIEIREREGIGIGRAQFGDCNDIVNKTLIEFKKMHINAVRQGGVFIANPYEEEEYDHTWIVINNDVFDSTIDQFFSSLDVDLITEQTGIYYSHPAWDGDWLIKRYKHY